MPDLRRRVGNESAARAFVAHRARRPECRGWSTEVPPTAESRCLPSPSPHPPARRAPARPPSAWRRMLPRACCRLAWAAALIVLPAFIAARAQTPVPTYEKSTEASIQGRVLSVVHSTEDNVHLLVSSGGQTFNVYIAPDRFLKLLGIIFHTGEKVEIVGSRVTSQGAPLMLARMVKREGSEITLRHEDGTPAWEGWLN
jgi:hypothetical protein